jgi:hypothetical protein
MNSTTAGRADERADYQVEVSGWDAKECFFVEKSTLAWTESAGKTVALTALIRIGSVLFVRLIQPLGAGNRFPVPYGAVKFEADREGREGRSHARAIATAYEISRNRHPLCRLGFEGGVRTQGARETCDSMDWE